MNYLSGQINCNKKTLKNNNNKMEYRNEFYAQRDIIKPGAQGATQNNTISR